MGINKYVKNGVSYLPLFRVKLIKELLKWTKPFTRSAPRCPVLPTLTVRLQGFRGL